FMNSPEFIKPKTKEKTKELEKESQILNVERKDKYKTIDELFVQSQPSSIYYTLLVLSVVIVTCGLLLQNAPIVIGGMLVTPILTPILVISLGISTAELGATKGPLILLVKSTLFSIVISCVFTLLFGIQDITQIFVNDLRTAMLYFIVASASGIAATFAWVRKEVSDILPGVAISVSLVPPLSLLGINLGTFSFEYARFYLIIYFLNLFGIIVGSLIVFSLLKFQKSKKIVKEKVKEVEDLKKFKKAKDKAQKAVEKMEQVKKNVSEAIELEEQQQKKKSGQDE
ncbi:DUF389 domain-containing protein, partial [Candidatus Peregrinibacteria bacterium]|nr:DUF389 domain-containing protein [Candidatus Peregrinibacteria bacterium]